MAITTILTGWTGEAEQCDAVRQFARDYGWEIQPEQALTWDASYAADYVADELLCYLNNVPADAEALLRSTLLASAEKACAEAREDVGRKLATGALAEARELRAQGMEGTDYTLATDDPIDIALGGTREPITRELRIKYERLVREALTDLDEASA